MKGILSLNRLAFTLGISRTVLEDVSENKSKFYRPYTKKEYKLDGSLKLRVIDNPTKAIRQIQKKINSNLLREEVVELPNYMTGSIKNRSVKDNARPHVHKPAMLMVDISNCFPSINSSDVYNLYRIRLSCSPAVSKVLTKLTTYGNRLPQGAPTSPALCNLILAPMSAQLNQLALENGVCYTHYVDDLTFSGSVEGLVEIRPLVLKIVKEHGFKVNTKKLKLLKANERMSLTGLVVNKNLSVGRKYIREIQRDIMRNRSTAIVNGKIAFVKLVQSRRAKKLRRKVDIKNQLR